MNYMYPFKVICFVMDWVVCELCQMQKCMYVYVYLKAKYFITGVIPYD